ncbi:MAG: hypothetical protein AAFN81_22325, partial [Bacteroidota bacterium]
MITHKFVRPVYLLAMAWSAVLNAQCDIFPIDLSDYICDDNGTPGDPSDDTFTFTITMDGIGQGADYNYNNAFVSGTGAYGVPETIGPIPVSGTPINLGFTDVDNPNCVYQMNLDPGPGCINPSCALNAQFVNYECDDGGTDTDPSDDTFTVDLLVQGVGTFSAGWDATGFVNTSGTYGIPEPLGPFTVFTGATGVQVTDNDNPACLDFATVFSPGSCSNGCNITTVFPFNVFCSDAGTPGDTSDDFIVIDLFVAGDNESAGFTITSTVGTLPNANGAYNIGSIFQLFDAAPATTTTITITDNDDPSCQATIEISIPDDCGVPSCEITDVTVSDLTCFDTGTSTPDDDVYTFVVEVSGDNLGSGWTSNDPSNNFGNYNQPDLFGPFLIADGPQTITFTDNDDPSCTFTITVDPPLPCSVAPACNIIDAGLVSVQCLDGGTPNDPSDDFINFLINPTGTGLGSFYIIEDPTGTTIYGNGVYGSPASGTSLPGDAGNGDLTVVIVDGDDPTCTLTLTIPDPGTCSEAPPCSITDLGLQLIGCSDNGTPNNPDDDFYEFILNPVGVNLSNRYTVNSVNGPVIPFVANYGGPTTFFATNITGITTITINVIDEDDANCTLSFTITLPPDCGSEPCNIDMENLSDVICLDAGTPSDPSDDQISFTLNVTGSGVGVDYSLVVSGGASVSPGTGPYGIPTTFTLSPGSAGNGDVTINIIDNTDFSCIFSFVLPDPGSCSDVPACNLTDAGLGTVTCNDFGTPNSPGDDFLEVELNPTGVGLSGSYIVTSPILSASLGFGNYGSPTIQQFLNAGANPGIDIPITITDADDPNCSITIFVTNTAPCSIPDPCTIEATVDNVLCNDNGTPNDPLDDTFTFELLVNGTNT